MTYFILKSKLLTLVLVMFFAQSLIGQANIETAEKQYELNAYELAYNSYTQLLKENPDCLQCQLKIAEICRVLNNPEKAKIAYERAMENEPLQDMYLLGYGHTLKALGKYKEAKKVYEKFALVNPVVGAYFARSCDAAVSYLDDEDVFTTNDFVYNSILPDKALTIHNGNLVFTSFDLNNVPSFKKGWIKSEGHLYSLDISETLDPQRIQSDIKSVGNINAIAYSLDNSLCVYSKSANATRLTPVVNKEDAKSLYFSLEVDKKGDFKNAKPFPYNETGSSSTHPCLSTDGRTMYFSSNRNDGFGGFDLYMSQFDGSSWSKPTNLGAQINTEGNEITPSIAYDNSLHFASDFHMGMGGYDIFKSNIKKGIWSDATNLGKNVNSKSDDYFPLLNTGGELKYITSNRKGMHSGSDIFEVNRIGERLMVNANLSEPFNVDLETGTDIEPIFVMNEGSQFEIQEIENIDIIDTDILLAENEVKMPKAYHIPNFASSKNDNGAVRNVSYTSKLVRIPANVFFVQIASLSKNNKNIASYEKASQLGNVYKIFQNNLIKIRVGYYGDRTQAEGVLKEVKKQGFADAFITHEELEMGEIELIYSNFDNNYTATTTNESILNETSGVGYSDYKVRLAAYDNPLFFDIASVKGIAKLEQWSKGDWTIFLLGGFKSLKEAEHAKIKAINRGYIDAYIVIDNKGELERVVKN